MSASTNPHHTDPAPATNETPQEQARCENGGAAVQPKRRRRLELKLDGEFLTIEEAAALLRITPKALYSRIYRGQVPGLRRDGAGRWLIKRSELDVALDKGRDQGNGSRGSSSCSRATLAAR